MTTIPADELAALRVDVEAHRDSQDPDIRAGARYTLRFLDHIAALEKERASIAWVQCTTVSNECLGGCRSMTEHDRYVHRQLTDEVENLRPLVALHEDMTRLKRAAETERDTALADNAALTQWVSAHGHRIGRVSCPHDGGYACQPGCVAHSIATAPHPRRRAAGGAPPDTGAREERGLEKAAQTLLAKRDSIMRGVKPGTRRGGLEEAATIVRAMKEPEPPVSG